MSIFYHRWFSEWHFSALSTHNCHIRNNSVPATSDYINTAFFWCFRVLADSSRHVEHQMIHVDISADRREGGISREPAARRQWWMLCVCVCVSSGRLHLEERVRAQHWTQARPPAEPLGAGAMSSAGCSLQENAAGPRHGLPHHHPQT